MVCGLRVKPGENRCPRHRAGTGRRSSCEVCHARTDGTRYCLEHMPTEADRLTLFPYREGYRDPVYRKNRLARYEYAGGLCEFCGKPLDRAHFECHHVDRNPRNNRHENLRVIHHQCHPRGRLAGA